VQRYDANRPTALVISPGNATASAALFSSSSSCGPCFSLSAANGDSRLAALRASSCPGSVCRRPSAGVDLPGDV
jgi:hypothetical protein